MSARLTFRPHHFLCALGYRGKGYSDLFTANMNRIVTDGLTAPAGDETEITVTFIADSICAPCPKRRGDSCISVEQISALDTRHAVALDLTDGQTLTWGAAKQQIKKHVPPGALETLCAGCQWRPLGYCDAALNDLHR